MTSSAESGDLQKFDVIIIGAGFAGICALYKLRSLGFSCVVLESAPEIGGTWYHNRYPGARCDIESLDYSFSFSEELQQEWHWTERYAAQPEILSYLNHVADLFELRPDIVLNCLVADVHRDDRTSEWVVRDSDGHIRSAQFCIMATGVLSAAQVPSVPGLSSFSGSWYHTADWPRPGVDFTGKRVGVIGTGSSGTQLIPHVAEQARELVIFQRTANFCMPAQNHPLDPATEREWKANYSERRAHARVSSFGHNQLSNDTPGATASAAERQAEFERRWQLGGLYMLRAFSDILTDKQVNDEAAEFVRGKISAAVHDPDVAQALMPHGLFLGAKRLCSGTSYYETFNRDNVQLVDVSTAPLERVVPDGIETGGRHFALDVIIFATGFDAMTGSFLRINPRGRDGLPLSDYWRAGPRTYLGLAVPGFPNLFIVAGPGSPSVFSNMVTSIEQHVEWIADCLLRMRADGATLIEATETATAEWVAHVDELSQHTLHRFNKKTWFYGGNIPGKPVVFMPYVGGVGRYAQVIDKVAADGYPGFVLAYGDAAQ